MFMLQQVHEGKYKDVYCGTISNSNNQKRIYSDAHDT